MASLPAKLDSWVTHVDPAVLGADSVRQLPALVDSLQALTNRLQEILEAQWLPQSPGLVTALHDDMQAWHQRVINAFQHLSADPSYKQAQWRARLDERMAQLDTNIKVQVNDAGENSLSSAEQENIYRLLSAYRSTSLALLDFVDVAANVDWAPWHEERFV